MCAGESHFVNRYFQMADLYDGAGWNWYHLICFTLCYGSPYEKERLVCETDMLCCQVASIFGCLLYLCSNLLLWPIKKIVGSYIPSCIHCYISQIQTFISRCNLAINLKTWLLVDTLIYWQIYQTSLYLRKCLLKYQAYYWSPAFKLEGLVYKSKLDVREDLD